MTIREFQDNVREQLGKFGFNWSNYAQYAHLVEEVGELGEALTVIEGERDAGEGTAAKADHSDPAEEIGDILFTTVQLANQLNLSIEDIISETTLRYANKLKKLQEVSQ